MRRDSTPSSTALIMDAERIMAEIGNDSNQESETQEVNEARCEFVRILKLLEKDLQARLLTNGTRELGEDFASLSDRVEAFRKISAGHEGDINDLEDSYADLILEIREMVNAEERSIFGNQSIFYVSSRDQSKLGSLFHFKDVNLTNEQIEFVKQVAFQVETPDDYLINTLTFDFWFSGFIDEHKNA